MEVKAVLDACPISAAISAGVVMPEEERPLRMPARAE